MEWNKAKKYTIFILLILNIVLFALSMYKSFDTRLSNTRVNTITQLLKDKGITLTAQLPSRYKPMPNLVMNEFVFDNIRLQNIFMSGEQNVRRTEEYNSVVFVSDTARTSIRGSVINYNGRVNSNLSSIADGMKYAEDVVAKVNEYFGGYRFHSSQNLSDGYTLRFYEVYNGINIYSNYMYFTIKGDSVTIVLNYAEPLNELNTRKNIFAADEALYSAMPNILQENKNPVISSVELGYYVISDFESTNNEAIPVYLIVANNKEYYVDALNGRCF